MSVFLIAHAFLKWVRSLDLTRHLLCVFGNRYRPVIFADFLGADELLVVEEPWLKIMRFPTHFSTALGRDDDLGCV